MGIMKEYYRLLSIVIALGLTLVFVGPAAAQYGEDPPETVVIGAGKADSKGQFFASYTAPSEIAERYLIYVVGTDKDGEPFELVVASVSSSFEGLTWTLNGVQMLPGSDFVLEARYHEGTDLGPQVLGITQLPTTGSDARSLAGLGVVLLVVGGALFYGARVRDSQLA